MLRKNNYEKIKDQKRIIQIILRKHRITESVFALMIRMQIRFFFTDPNPSEQKKTGSDGSGFATLCEAPGRFKPGKQFGGSGSA